MTEPDVEGSEYEDDSDIDHQPRPELMPEDEDVRGDDEDHHREHPKRGARGFGHETFLARDLHLPLAAATVPSWPAALPCLASAAEKCPRPGRDVSCRS